MKRWIFIALLMICRAVGYADEVNSMSGEDDKMLREAVEMVDKGLSVSALQKFDILAMKYPENYIVQYERMYCLYMLNRFDDVIKCEKSLLGNKDVTPIAYQMIGNAYDNIGDRKNALKMYNDGLKRFPNSGILYLELGNMSMSESDYVAAFDYYNRGIVVQPDFASNYYRAALLGLSSDNMKVWGLVYAESEILLAPSNSERHEEMAKKIADCLKESIRVDYEGSPVLKVSLVPSRGITVDKSKDTYYLEFPGVYEGAITQPIKKLVEEKTPLTFDLQQLIFIRKGLVETYYLVTDNLYGNSMYLLEFQKQVIDAGHWDAYNYFLFMPAFPLEFEMWYLSNSQKLDAFIDWYNRSPYHLGEGRSVDKPQIFNCYRPLGMFEALSIQAALISESSEK